MVFWAGLIGVVVGAVVGVSLRRRQHPQALLLTMTAAAVVYILVTAVGALVT